MCGVPHMTREKADMKPGLFRKIVDECAAEGHKLSWFHQMGEPLLHPQIDELMLYATKHLPLPPAISTNGMLLDEAMCWRLKDAGASTIMVCLSSMRHDVYNRLRVGGDISIVINNIHVAVDMGFDVIVQKMVTIYNHDEDMEAYEAEFGENRFAFKVTDWPANKFKPGGKYIGYNEPFEPSCHFLASHLPICQDGRVAICCFDYDCTSPCGDVNEDTISDIAAEGFDYYVRKLRARNVRDMPACYECLSMKWRTELPADRFVTAWRECI